MKNKQNPDSPGSPSRADVHKMFDRIAPRYDLLNRLLSFGRDVAWRKRVARYLPRRDNLNVLDLATGTGDLLISLITHGKTVTAGVGMDMAEKMLALANRKIADRGLDSALAVAVGDARKIPFADCSFDAVSIAFGIRNVEPVSAALEQMHRILNYGGKALILEFSLPSNAIMRRFYLLYFRYILPLVGSVISGDSYAYRYLNRTVETFPYGEDFCRLMLQAGFENVTAHPQTFGIATIYEGTRRVDNPSVTTSKSQTLGRLADRTHAALRSRDSAARIVRLSAELPNQSPLDWLRRQAATPRVYWANRDGSFETAGAGVADTVAASDGDTAHPFSRIQDRLADTDNSVRYYGGFRFDSNRQPDTDWQPFGSYLFVLPRIELTRTSGKTHLVVNLLPEQDRDSEAEILTELERFMTDGAAIKDVIPKIQSRTDYPDKQQWRRMIGAAYDLFDSGTLQKIVLARKTVLSLSENADGLSLLSAMRSKSTQCYCFYVEPQPCRAFQGVTPERLYLREGNTVTCDAIAGTRARGANEEADARLGQELLASDKDRREQELVVESILKAMAPLCEDAPQATTDVQLLKLARVQHLMTRLSFRMRKSVDDNQILTALHPTAAVGGLPRETAVQQINQLEPFDRGWYAGPVGWIARDRAEFAVAIRSATAIDNRLNLFAGAGILRGSEADLELSEIESKISGIMETFRR